MVCRQYGEFQAAQELEEEEIALCSEQGFTRYLAYATMMKGWHLVEQGQQEEGFAQMRQGLAVLRATGAKELVRGGYFAQLAEAYSKMGQVEEGFALLAEALDTVRKTGPRLAEAELYRLKGELLLQLRVRNPESGIPKEAEECFRQAIDVARCQSAKSWELRAVMSLSQLWQKQGKKDEARHMLAEIYGWFTEGFDTKDLQEAKALLEELT